MSLLFIAVVTGGRTAGYRASFPDIPGCDALGRSLPEVLVNAQMAAQERLQALVNAGRLLPVATPVEGIGVAPGAMAMLIDVPLPQADPFERHAA